MRKVVLDGIKWLTLARLVAQITRWAATIIAIRLLAPNDFGLAALAQTVLSILELFGSFGLGAAIIQSPEISRRALQLIFGMITAINLILAALMWGVAPYAATFYGEPELTQIIRVLALTFLFVIAGAIPANLLIRDMNFRAIAIAQVLSGSAGAAVLLIMAYSGYGYWALIWGGIAILGVDTIVKIIARPVFVVPVFNFPEAKQYLTFGSLVMASTIIHHLYVSLDVVIAGIYWSAETLGIYAVALQLAVLPLNKMMPMIRQVAFPAFSKNQSDLEKTRGYMVKSMQLAMAISFPIFFGISSISVLLVPLLLGSNWESAALPIMILCVSIPFRMMVELYEPPLFATNRPKIVVINSLVILCIMIPTFFISVQWDVLGLSLGWLLVFPLVSLGSSYWYCKSMEINLATMFGALQTPLLGSTLMLGVVYGYIQGLTGMLNPWVLMVSAIGLGAAVYLLYIYIFDRSLFNQYLEIVTRG